MGPGMMPVVCMARGYVYIHVHCIYEMGFWCEYDMGLSTSTILVFG